MKADTNCTVERDSPSPAPVVAVLSARGRKCVTHASDTSDNAYFFPLSFLPFPFIRKRTPRWVNF